MYFILMRECERRTHHDLDYLVLLPIGLAHPQKQKMSIKNPKILLLKLLTSLSLIELLVT